MSEMRKPLVLRGLDRWLTREPDPGQFEEPELEEPPEELQAPPQLGPFEPLTMVFAQLSVLLRYAKKYKEEAYIEAIEDAIRVVANMISIEAGRRAHDHGADQD